MLTSNSNSGSLTWKVPFSKRNNLLPCSNVQMESQIIEKFVQCTDQDTFRNVFRKEMKKQISKSSTLSDALDISIVLDKIGLKLSQFNHLSDNAKILQNLIAKSKQVPITEKVKK